MCLRGAQKVSISVKVNEMIKLCWVLFSRRLRVEVLRAPVRQTVRQLLLEEPPPLATHWAAPFQCIKIHLSQQPISIKQMTTVLPGSIST